MAGGSGVNLAGADAWDDVMRAGVDTSYTGQTMPWDLPMDDPNWQPSPEEMAKPWDTPVTSETVDVTAQRIPPVNAGGAIGAGISATLPATTDLTEFTDRPPDDDLIDTGDGDDVLDGDGNDTITTPDWGDAIKDWILKNPKLAMTLAGSFLGNVGGDNTTPPPVPGTGPQANLTSTPAASLGRRYVAPPPGYRPGIDPEAQLQVSALSVLEVDMADSFSFDDLKAWILANPDIVGSLIGMGGTLYNPAQASTSTQTQAVNLPDYIARYVDRTLDRFEAFRQ